MIGHGNNHLLLLLCFIRIVFNHNLISLPNIKRIDGATRYYEVPTGEKYPSVTSVLDAMSDKSALDVWRDRIGHEEAAKITKMAGRRGSNIHEMCERYVLNQELDLRKAMPFNVVMFNQIKNQLDLHVNDIRVSEGQLFSHKLKVAGSVDLVANWDNKPTIIDFKTSIKDKQKDWITNYFLQATMYSYMFWEMTGILCDDIVILICVEQGLEAQVFKEKASKWLPSVFSLCKQYHKNFT